MHMPRTILLQQLDSALWQGRWASFAHSWADCCAKAQAWTAESMFEATLHIVDQVPLRKTSENLKGFFFSPVELTGNPYIFTKENPSLCIGTTFLAMAVHVQACQRQEGFVWITAIRIHFTRSGSLKQKTRAQKKAKKSHLVTWVFLCVCIFPILSLHWRTGGVNWSSSSFHTVRHFTCLHKLVLALPHPFPAERPWEHTSTGCSWTLIQTRWNLFPVRGRASVEHCQRFRSAIRPAPVWHENCPVTPRTQAREHRAGGSSMWELGLW